MSLHCDLDLENSKTTFTHQTLAYGDASPGKSLMINYSALQKISSEQTFIDISKFRCDLHLDRSTPFIFSSQGTLASNKNSIKPVLVAKRSAVQKIE